jgi:hypothetical protein
MRTDHDEGYGQTFVPASQRSGYGDYGQRSSTSFSQQWVRRSASTPFSQRTRYGARSRSTSRATAGPTSDRRRRPFAAAPFTTAQLEEITASALPFDPGNDGHELP